MINKTTINLLFPQFDINLLEYIEEIGSVRQFKAGTIMMRTGEYFKSSMLIVDGLVKLYREDEEGNEFFMYYLKPGDACALSMICATKNEASEIMAVASEDTSVIAIPIKYMDDLMVNYRNWYYFVLDTYRKRFEELLNTVDGIAFKAMDDRLEFYLKRQSKILNKENLGLTHQQIASDLNTSREVISRLLKKMEKEKMVKLGRNMITILK